MPPWNRLPSVMPVSVSFPFLNGTWPGPACLLTLPGSPGTFPGTFPGHFASHFDCRQGVSQTGKGRLSAVFSPGQAARGRRPSDGGPLKPGTVRLASTPPGTVRCPGD